jgi:hypothetical protein
MRDWEIRRLLREKVFTKIQEDDPSSCFVEEMEICRGDARVDIAVINGSLSGYEIKSQLDDLRRLPNQISVYSRVLDSVSVVVAPDHLTEIEKQIPRWWGILTLSEVDESFSASREPSQNPCVDAFSVATLLWRDEALAILSSHGLDIGIRSKPREAMWRRLLSLPLPVLQSEVRAKLKARGEGWRSGSQRTSGDASSQLSAT